MKKSIVPFGPQHPVLPEPVQLRLELEEEKVISVVPVLGYIHRGLEKVAEMKTIEQDMHLIERVCGICSFMHSMAYCMGIEELMDIKIDRRSLYLRIIWAEVHRMHSHLLALGLLADAFGFENLFMQLWRTRERVMDAMEATTGARIMLGTCCIGGVRRDIEADGQKFVLDTLNDVEKDLNEILPVLLNDYTVKQRLCGVGVIDPEVAFNLGAIGPTIRGAGVKIDHRMTGYSIYGELDFEPVVEKGGDCHSRTRVRCGELYQSIDLVRQAFAKIPKAEGPLKTPYKGFPEGEVIIRVEQPRGEVLYYLKANGTDKLERMRLRTPTFANLPPLLEMLKGCQLADIGSIVLSIDPCVSCTER